jgi:hypothetical protein
VADFNDVLCVCGHRRGVHEVDSPNPCCWVSGRKCRCPGFDPQPAVPALPPQEWLDAPTCDGIWARAYDGETVEASRVKGGLFLGAKTEAYGASKWFFVGPMPPDPPKPLPKERDAKIAARVINDGRRGWEASIFVDGNFVHYADHFDTKEQAIGFAREQWGVEPEVSNG